MRIFILLSLVSTLILSSSDCAEKKNVLKARLEVKGICSNYTIKLLKGKLDTSTICANWKDQYSGKSYTNVFGLNNTCDFPASLKQGDEFYFILDTVSAQTCMVCQAYYPSPPKKLIIKVVEK